MRGKRSGIVAAIAAVRNIPAYAGKTLTPPVQSSIPAEHPRVCGENLQIFRAMRGRMGTSPRMRGKRFLVPSAAVGARNIPAYAGKTGGGGCGGGWGAEHPRVCGENYAKRKPLAYAAGTSPRMRGKRMSAIGYASLPRNIPAYAGKTRITSDRRPTSAEHPRVCGENLRQRSRRE